MFQSRQLQPFIANQEKIICTFTSLLCPKSTTSTTPIMESNIDPRSATDSFKYYAYSPSLPAAIIFAALFALVTVLHSFQMFRSKTWFMIPFVIGGLLETGGYICRSISATEAPGPYGLGPYLVQALLVLISPTLFAASIYMELGRIVVMIEGEKELFIRRTWLTKVSLTSRLYLLHVTHNMARVPSTNAANRYSSAATFSPSAFNPAAARSSPPIPLPPSTPGIGSSSAV